MWIDGGLATTLQQVGLPPHHPVEPWVLTRPAAVRQVHQAFVEAGAEIVLTATFRSLPGVTERWEEVVRLAVALARDASPPQVWLSVGPGNIDAEVALVAHAAPLGLDGIVLETHTDPATTLDVVRQIRRIWHGPLVASLAPRADGALLNGHDPAPWCSRLLEAGADGTGFNCGLGPDSARAAVSRAEIDPERLWIEVAGGATEATVATLVELESRSRWCGGCCGVSPALLAQAVHPGR